MPAFAQASCACPIHCPSAASLDDFPDDVKFGLMKVSPPATFRPDNPRAGVPGILRQLRAGLPAAILPLINATEWSRQSGNWVVATDNAALLLVSVTREQRPDQPDALPRHLERWPGDVNSALDEMSRRNAEIMAVATVPAVWWQVVRNPRFRAAGTSCNAVPAELATA